MKLQQTEEVELDTEGPKEGDDQFEVQYLIIIQLLRMDIWSWIPSLQGLDPRLGLFIHS